MNHKITLAIPKPCNQSWEQMKPTELGGFCQQCNKEVVDFTKMSTAELQRYFTEKHGEICGRVESTQIVYFNKLNHLDVSASNRFSYKWLLASVFTLFVHSNANSQQPKLKDQSPTHLVEPGNLEKRKFTYSGIYEVKGVVKTADDKLPIPQASVKIVSANQGIATDSLGRFKLMVKGEFNQKLKLQISCLGYATQYVEIILGHNKELIIELLLDNLVMGEVVVVGYQAKKSSVLVGQLTCVIAKRPSFFRRVINYVGGLFH